MIHHCPKCGAMSYHGPGAAHWALRCPCGHTAAQVPHAPDNAPARRHPSELAASVIVYPIDADVDELDDVEVQVTDLDPDDDDDDDDDEPQVSLTDEVEAWVTEAEAL